MARLLLFLRSWLMALCLGGAGTMSAQAQTASTELPGYSVVIKDGRIIPARLEVPAGKKIKLAIRNEGPGPSEFENLSLRIEKVLAPGASSFVVIHALAPGTYRFVDEFHPATAEMLLIAQ